MLQRSTEVQLVANRLANGEWVYKIALAILLPLGLTLAIFVILTTPAVSPAAPTEIVCGDLRVTDVVLYERALLSRVYDVVGLIDGKAAHLRLRPANCILLYGPSQADEPAPAGDPPLTPAAPTPEPPGNPMA